MLLGYIDLEGFCLLGHDAEVIVLIEVEDALFHGEVGISGRGMSNGAWWYEALVNG